MSFIRLHRLCICWFLSSLLYPASAKKELKLLQVLSANKFYVPDHDYDSPVFEIPKHLSYGYFLRNAVDVPNSVKMDLFNLGVSLRKTYGAFIGSTYFDEVIKMQTSACPVSIIAGELINAGLWPPVGTQIWKDDLLWQPIPFVYKAAKEDTELLGTLCPNFERETARVLQDHQGQSQVERELLSFLNREGHLNLTNPIEVSLLHLALENSAQLNQSRPEWLNKVFPGQKMTNTTLSAYDLLSKTLVQKRLNGGSFLKTVVADFKAHVDGVLSKARKINIYSGDERIFAGVLKNLNIPLYELPSAGAALIFELYAEANEYFIKVVYYTGSNGMEMIPYALNGCKFFCELERFTELVAAVLPDDELFLCGSETRDQPKTKEETSSNSRFIANNLFIVSSLVMIYLVSKIYN